MSLWSACLCENPVKSLCLNNRKNTNFNKYFYLRHSRASEVVALYYLCRAAHLRTRRQKAPPVSPRISAVPFCVLTTPVSLSLLCPAGPDSSDWGELLAVLQTVCQLQRRVHGGKCVFEYVCRCFFPAAPLDQLKYLMRSLKHLDTLHRRIVFTVTSSSHTVQPQRAGST